MKNTDILIKYPGLDEVRNFQTGKLLIQDAFITRSCPLCRNVYFKLLGKVDIFPIVQCDDCDMIYNYFYPNHKYSLSSIDTRIPDQYDPKKAFYNKNFYGGRGLLKKVFPGRSDKHREPINFLDFGCGQGWLVRAARKLGWNAYGIDLNPNQQRLAKDLYDVDVYPCLGDIDNSISFDFVAMNHVLSVLEDPLDILIKIRTRMKDRGLIFVADPNTGSFSVKRNGLIHYYFTPPRFNHFTKKTLQAMLKRAGFSEIIRCQEGRLEFYIFFSRTKKTIQYFHKDSLQPVSNLPRNSRLVPFFEKPFAFMREILKRVGFSFIEKLGLGDEIQIVARK